MYGKQTACQTIGGKQHADSQNTRKNSVSTGMESSKETVKTQERIQSAQVWKAARRPSKHKKEFNQYGYGKQTVSEPWHKASS